MLPSLLGEKDEAVPLRVNGVASYAKRPGLAISFVIHGLVAFFLIFHMRAALPPSPPPAVPVDLVQLAEETIAPAPSRDRALPQRPQAATRQRQASLTPPRAPQARTIERPAIPNPPAETAPPEQPRDELETKLQGLANLKQPSTDPRLLNGAGTAGINANGNGAPGPYAAYSVKDYIRAQVERRWNLNTEELGARNFTIPIHVVLAADGTVTKAEIVDQKRYIADVAYRSIALSARNAVLLSSPFALPLGQVASQGGVMDMTLDLNPRDTLK
ncbi:MAG TPA: hypothetical protein VGM72_12970 [Micropepsaceae bacterium]